MKLLLLNASANTGSTGRIAEEIGLLAQQSGYEVRFAYGRKAVNSKLPLIKIGNKWDMRWHGVKSRFWDAHGFGSRHATKALIKELEKWRPDIVNIHNLHGYYINIELLFEYLRRVQIPVVWTFHDCWPFTGHCAFYESVNCTKWKTECSKCPKYDKYPESWFVDRSAKNFRDKKHAFTGHNNLTIITPSHWLASQVKQSFLQHYEVKVIHNGIDLNKFKPMHADEIRSFREQKRLPPGQVLLGVASIWDERKGLSDFIELSKSLKKDCSIVLIGLSKKQIQRLPSNILGIERTENIRELALWYNLAHVFINPTYQDNFPTTNIEALACGTPVITYNTGGSPEAIDGETGLTVTKGDVKQLKQAIMVVLAKDKQYYTDNCRSRAVRLFNASDRYLDYVSLFNSILD